MSPAATRSLQSRPSLIESLWPGVNDEALPATLGRDLSGVVERCGPTVQAISPGETIFALLGYDRGAYAQYVLVKPDEWARKLFALSSPLPDNISASAQAEGYPIGPGARGFAFNADLVELIRFLDIGTRPSNLR